MTFSDLDSFIALPRLNAVALSPGGTALIASVGALNTGKTAWITSLWWVDPSGERPSRRLTRGEKGESTVAFTPSGDVLFVAKRPGSDDADTPASLWLLPREGGDPRVVATHPGGFNQIVVRGTTLVAAAPVLQDSTDLDADEEARKARKDAKVSAILHETYPVRFWDHDLGPDHDHLYAADLAGLDDEGTLTLRDITPDAGTALRDASLDLAPDGSFVTTTWRVHREKADLRTTLVRIDTVSGDRTVVIDEAEIDVLTARISPDGTRLAAVTETISTPETAPRVLLELVDATTGERRRLAEDWDNWPGTPEWLPDGSGLVMAADADGRAPIFAVPLDGSAPRRLTSEAAYSNLEVGPDAIYALRTSYEYPNEVVRLPLPGSAAPSAEPAPGLRSAGRSPDRTSFPLAERQERGGAQGVMEPARIEAGGPDEMLNATVLRGPAERPQLPGSLTEIETTAEDGSRVRAWLALPAGASEGSPAPLVLWIHGGPLGSWNGWSWRWCPWLMVAKGYAVLLPDPALSTGYGQEFIQRGWGSWGAKPFTDLMAITDAAATRPDIDETRTAAMGGSFGGYMANWVAGHTDRFKAIVTHASLWALDQFGPTTDAAMYWLKEMTPRMAEENSPHLFVENIRTPMLVIHGDKDYRVPIGEGLRLWYELQSASGLPAGPDGRSAHKFLYFPNENHWVLTPQHAKIWYQMVLDFLGEHVLGQEPGKIGLLG